MESVLTWASIVWSLAVLMFASFVLGYWLGANFVLKSWNKSQAERKRIGEK